MFGFGPQARLVARIAERVTDEQLAAPSPWPEYAVRNVLGHVLGLAHAFDRAAHKDFVPELDRDPAAWAGMTRAGGLDLPGEEARS
ncbi:maleylpyruvate isomerase N-terminal domain-containing protein [Streptomyces sp. NPDC020607]|uniref:maleylpyruvate isomerase N-terminal domain-containing protein n=1 Tax=Streptomyces sp. NPDC020607 TaxID=3365082 RepID=UPI00378F06B4